MIYEKQITSSKVKKSVADILGINQKYLKVRIVKGYFVKNVTYDISINGWKLPIFWKIDETDLIMFENIDEIIKQTSLFFWESLDGFILKKLGEKSEAFWSQNISIETLIKNLQLLDKLDLLTK